METDVHVPVPIVSMMIHNFKNLNYQQVWLLLLF